MLAFVLLAGVAGLDALSFTAGTTEQLVSSDRPLLELNAAALQGLTDAQTSQRGYLATGDERVLEHYGPGLARFAEATAAKSARAGEDGLSGSGREARASTSGREARASTSGREARASTLVGAEAAIGRQWISEYAEPIVALQREDRAAAVRLAQTGRGDELFNRFRQANAATGRHIAGRLTQDLADVQRPVQLVKWGLIGLAVAALATGVVVANYTTCIIVNPLAKLRATLADLQSGELHARVVPEGPTEIREVALCVNALAVETQRLTSLHAERVERERTIRSVSAMIREDLDVALVVQRIASSVGPALNVDRAAVRFVLADEVGPVAAEWPEVPRGAGIGEPAGVADELTDLLVTLGEKATLRVPDVPEAAWLPRRLRDYLRAQQAHAVVWRQLRAGPTVLAVLELVSSDPEGVWTDSDARLLDAFTREIEGTLSHALLFERQRQIAERLRALDRAKTDFVSTASHELRTPLTSIVGYLSMLGEGEVGPLTDEQRDVFEVVDRNVGRLLAMIEDLLVLSRVESSSFTVSLAPVDLGAVVAEIVREFQPRLTAGSIGVEVELADGLMAQADRPQVERVLLNLLTNAAKFTPAGGRVTITARRLPGCVEVAVADTGMGISHDDKQQLFTRFYRSAGAQDSAIPGSGLGLAISKGIVEAHGGVIDVESALGRGSTFRFRLPEAVAPATGEQRELPVSLG